MGTSTPNFVHVVWFSSEVLLLEYQRSTMHLDNFCSINYSTKIHFPRGSIIERFDCGEELKNHKMVERKWQRKLQKLLVQQEKYYTRRGFFVAIIWHVFFIFMKKKFSSIHMNSETEIFQKMN